MFSLQEFLFGSAEGRESSYRGSNPTLDRIKVLEEKIEILQNQVNFLKQKFNSFEESQNMLSADDRRPKIDPSYTFMGKWVNIYLKAN